MVPLLADRVMVSGLPTAYVCQHYTCRLPVTTPVDLERELDAILNSDSPAGEETIRDDG
jgi:hypothetical protein